METAIAAGSPEDEPIDAEVISSGDDSYEPSGSPDMPEDEASWVQDRLPLPDYIVNNEYDTRSLIIAKQDGPGETQLVPTSFPNGNDDWYKIKAYEAQLAEISGKFVLRVGRLRQLAFGLTAAATRLQDVNRLIEQERQAVNRRNNEINQSISDELKRLRDDYLTQRAKLSLDIADTENKRIEHKQSRHVELESARAEYWDVRTEACAQRDARLEVIRQERLKLNFDDKAHAESLRGINKAMIENDIAELSTRIGKLTEEIDEKLREITQLRFQIIGEAEKTRDQAREKYASMILTVEQELLEQREKLIEAQDKVIAEYQPRLDDIRVNIHRYHQEAIKVSDDHKKDVAHTKGQVERLQDAAHRNALGHTPDTTKKAFLAKLSETLHLVPADGRNVWFIWAHRLYEAILLIVTGGLFGISVGLLFGLIKTADVSTGRNGILLVIFAAVGIAIFATIGRFIHHMWTYVAERIGRSPQGTDVANKTLTVILAVLLSVLIVGLETAVERYGLGQIIANRRLMGDGFEVPELMIWVIASIVSVPFVLFHAISAYRDATHYQADLLRNAAEGEFHAQATTNSALDEHGHAAAKLRGLDHEPDAEKRTASYWEQQESKLLDERDNRQECIDLRNFDDGMQLKLDNDPRIAVLNLIKNRTLDDIEAENASIAELQGLLDQLKSEKTDAEHALEQKRDALMSLTSPSADLTERGISHYVNDIVVADNTIEGEVPKLPADASAAEIVAYQKWNSLRRAIGQDPTVVYFNKRIKTLQTAIRSLDVRIGKERKRLLDRQRSIEVRIFQSQANQNQDSMLWSLHSQAQTDYINAQSQFDEEQENLRRLLEAPFGFKWMENVRQFYFKKNSVQRQLDTRNRTKVLPPVQNKQLPSKD